jgi:hypothetical protein
MKKFLRKLLGGAGPLERRYQIVNHFVRTRRYRRYLEIGVSKGRSITKVACAEKTGVDPAPRCEPDGWTLHAVPSDDFFRVNRAEFDLIFIDGLHHAEQVVRDIYHSLEALAEGGIILLHDCNPATEGAQLREHDAAQSPGWNGDVWKAIVFVRESEPGLYCRVLDTDQGIGVVVPRGHGEIAALDAELERSAAARIAALDWDGLVANRMAWLGLLPGVAELEREFADAGLCPPARD